MKKIIFILFILLMSVFHLQGVTTIDTASMSVSCQVLASGPIPVVTENLVTIEGYDSRILYLPNTIIPIKINLNTLYYGYNGILDLDNTRMQEMELITNTYLDGCYSISEGMKKRDGRIVVWFNDGLNWVTTFTSIKTVSVDSMIMKNEVEEKILISDKDPYTRIHVGVGTLYDDAKIYITKQNQYDNAIAYQFTMLNAHTGALMKDFKKDIRLQIHYDINAINVISKLKIKNDANAQSQLIIAEYDGVQWMPVGGVADIANRTVTANIRHFSTYGIIVDKGLDFYIGPNPFTPNGDNINDEVIFKVRNVIQDRLSIKIYSLVGRFVKELEVNQSANSTQFIEASWDGTDSHDNKTEDGVYIYQIKYGHKKYNGTIVLAK